MSRSRGIWAEDDGEPVQRRSAGLVRVLDREVYADPKRGADGPEACGCFSSAFIDRLWELVEQGLSSAQVMLVLSLTGYEGLRARVDLDDLYCRCFTILRCIEGVRSRGLAGRSKHLQGKRWRKRSKQTG